MALSETFILGAMLFSSTEFLFLFLPITWLAFTLSGKTGNGHLQRWVLITASLFFYGWYDWRYLALILGSVLVNYTIGQRLHQGPHKSLLSVGIGFNLALIGYFKYADFFIENLNEIGFDLSLLHLALPLAISFFTFQQIAYLVDAHKQKSTTSSFSDYLLFVVFFPQLIAGPIVHHQMMTPQFHKLGNGHVVRGQQYANGLLLLSLGLFKKVVVADTLAGWVDPAFAQVESLGVIDAWVAVLGYTFQIYFDFSGYSEMAMGLALLFGFTLPRNFDSPYRSLNIAEFWRRWHITLGAFLREYLYIPLGGSRHGTGRMLCALMVTMLLGGLWHGAGWTFVLWGAMHGGYLIIHRLWRDLGVSMPSSIAMVLTFFAVMLAWVPFRAETFADTLLVWQAMAGFGSEGYPVLIAKLVQDATGMTLAVTDGLFNGWELFVAIALAYFVMRRPNVHEYLDTFRPSFKNMLGTGAMVLLVVALIGDPNSFIYFTF